MSHSLCFKNLPYLNKPTFRQQFVASSGEHLCREGFHRNKVNFGSGCEDVYAFHVFSYFQHVYLYSQFQNLPYYDGNILYINVPLKRPQIVGNNKTTNYIRYS